MRRSSRVLLLSVLAVATASAGCGDSSGTQAQSSASDARGVIASASDCVSFGAEAVKACSAAIERAVEQHESSSKSFVSIQLCEKDIGPQKCERSASGHYRAKLSAFMVTMGPPAKAEPLYPMADASVGFQTASKSKLLTDDHSVVFSSLALSVAEMQAARSKTGRGKKKS